MTMPARVLDLYHRALERAPGDRRAFLEQACAGDSALQAEVESLLAHDAGSFLDTHAAGAKNPIGRRLGAYTIVAPLGAGGMGEVYRARDTKLGRDVAIKILPAHFTDDPERRARFAREARVLAALSHPHIGAIYGLEESGGVSALVLELVEGPTLSQHLHDGALPFREALVIAQQIARGLEAAHAKGIVHRDLKPGNIALQTVGGSASGGVCAKILDFGLATTLESMDTQGSTVPIEKTAEGRILGTPAYMSPEQARGQTVDARTDVWAFGCLLYEMLAGRAAFRAASAPDIIAKILERDPDWQSLPPSTPLSVRRLLRRCLEKDPGRRLHSIADARLDIEEALAGKDADADTGDPRAMSNLWRRRIIPAVALSFALLVVGLLGVAFEYRRTEQRKQLRESASAIFYDLRALEASLVHLQRLDPASSDVQQAIYRRNRLTKTYDDYVDRLGLYEGKSRTERAVLRMARRLGEADLAVPAGFYDLTMDSVKKWSSSRQLVDGLARAREHDLIQTITRALDEKRLPRELLFLALQESNFDASLVGSQTRHGVPKGLWQFTPAVAQRYGLTLGPLSNEPRFDPSDQRHDARRSTEAAAAYLADLYSSEAAGSTLLVIASYNSGADDVLKRLESLPADPRERNFWSFYENNWLRQETREYVASIFAAALICEDGEVFNFPVQKIW